MMTGGLVPTTICGCHWRRVIHIFDAGLMLAVHVLQGSVLNYYIISHFSNSVVPYFWFVGDFLCLFVFAGTLTIAYKYFNRVTSGESLSDGSSFKLSPTRLINGYSTSRFGVLPLSYLSWIFYAGILIGKIAVIFKSGIPATLNTADFFGPQLLQVTIALASIIFFLLAESHNWAKHRSPRYHFVTSTCAHSGMAVLDTVALLSVLLPTRSGLLTGPPDYVLDIILVLGLINLLLPAIALHRLGLSEPTAEKCQAQLLLPFSVIHDLSHLILVDIPFLIVRGYLWIGHGQHTSLFMMKNVLGIIMTLRSLHPDLSELVRRRRRLHVEETNNPQHNSLLEMHDVHADNKTGEVISTEDVKPRDVNKIH